MTVYDSRSGIDALGPPPLWVCALLGAVLIAAGVFALGDLAFATIISVWALGFLLGVDLIAHGFAWLLYALQSARTTA